MSLVDVELSSLPARINLYLNSANRTLGDSPSSFEMTMSSTLVTADTNEIFFMNVIQFNTVPRYSDQPINVISITNFFVHVSGDLYLNDENYDNHNSSEIDNNNIIFSMAVDKPFNTCLSYNNSDGGNSFYFRLDNCKTNINHFKLEIRDQFHQLIPQFPDYNIVLQFTKKTRENVFLRPLLDIRNYILQLYLMIGTIYQKMIRYYFLFVN